MASERSSAMDEFKEALFGQKAFSILSAYFFPCRVNFEYDPDMRGYGLWISNKCWITQTSVPPCSVLVQVYT
jgi:hypothetical protein